MNVNSLYRMLPIKKIQSQLISMAQVDYYSLVAAVAEPVAGLLVSGSF
jgi:hypothetical protein